MNARADTAKVIFVLIVIVPLLVFTCIRSCMLNRVALREWNGEQQ